MRADTQLEYALFQLTPTRTRCELHVVAKGCTYKLASGLLKPFISHLKTAEEQLAKGGYSIRLEPPDPMRAPWFTKGTMERFVRFVSTPEVLERVSSVEVELLELEETTRQQTAETNESSGAGQTDSNCSKTASSQLSPGGKPVAISALEKTSKVATEGTETGGEESTKQRLLRALDARRMMLQKEQGMAFARALAAGFNLENMDALVLFAECFGANRLREACVNFLALCKKREEAGLGMEDLELMAADNSQADMSYIGTMGGNAMGISWPDPHGNGLDQLQSPVEGRPTRGEDGAEKLTRRNSLDEAWQSGNFSRLANGPGTKGDGDGGPGIVNGHPMMAAWQGQPHGPYLPGVHPYGAMHPGFAGPARPYPHYLGSPYMPPPYPDGNGWQAHPYWPGSHDSADGVHPRPQHQQTVSTPFPREKDAPVSGDDVHDDGEEFSNELSSDRTRRPTRRSASPRRRSASPMRRVQVGRSGGSKRSGMVVIRNINYIAPKAQQQDNKEDDDSEISDSWSEDGESDEDTFKKNSETLRASIEDAVGMVEGKNRATKDGKKKHSKKEKKKSSSKDTVLGADVVAGPDEDDLERSTTRQAEDVWMLGKRENGADDSKNLLREEELCSVNRVRQWGSYDPASENARVDKQGSHYPASESAYVDKQGRENASKSQSAEDSVLFSERDGYSRNSQSLPFDMFEQEHTNCQDHQDNKRMSLVDDSYMIADRKSIISKEGTTIEPDFEFSSKVMECFEAEKKLSDDSFIVLDRSTERKGANGEWRMPLNLESEMPADQNLGKDDVAKESRFFEPDDLFMVPERSQETYKRAWNTPLDYDMHVLAADMVDNGHESQDKDDEEENNAVELHVDDEEVEANPTEPSPRKVSEKDAKARDMKDMLEKRKSVGAGRPGRPNPLAEAQLRAEKLRVYKAGLQKSKKEKEEEERKRVEDLRNQRQQRIAARSNPGNVPSPPSARATKTTTPTGAKSSPKMPNKLSNRSSLSPSLSRERVSRVARPALDSPKSGETLVSRSVSSLPEIHRESKKTTSTVRASTGSQLFSHNLRSEKITEVNAHGKINGHTEDKVGRSRSSRTDERISRIDSGLAEERIRRSESARIEEKLGRTDSGREEKVDHSESGRIVEKVQTLTPKTVKKAAWQDAPTAAVKPAKGHLTDSKPVKKGVPLPSKPTVHKRNAVAPAFSVEEIVIEEKVLPVSQKEVPNAEKDESPPRAMEGKIPSSFLAENGVSDRNGIAHENGAIKNSSHAHNGSMSPPFAVAEDAISSTGKACSESRVFLPTQASSVLEASKEDVLPIESPVYTASIAGLDNREREVEVGSSVCQDDHAPVAHVLPLDTALTADMEADLHINDAHLVGHYSPPFVPPSEYSLSPFNNTPQPTSAPQEEFIVEANSTDPSIARSRKKWGDSKAKGLKRLLLLGRKSSRGSAQSASDVPSDGDEEDSPSSNGKNTHSRVAGDVDSFNEQASGVLVPTLSDASSGNSSTKGSRSIFSLSTFRGKSTAKA